MSGIQTIKVNLQRDSLQTPWGFRLQGGADFRSPFTINKITAGSPADGILHRGDIILEINQRPTNALLHAEALDVIQHAGGQITFLVQRGPNPLSSLIHSQQQQRPMSAMAWSLANAISHLDRNSTPPWSPSAAPLSPTACFRNRPMERIANPKPVLSQTGSPLMPGPVPSVSTKTRGYVPPPIFHTEPKNFYNTPPVVNASSPTRFTFPGSAFNNRTQTVSSSSTTKYQNSYDTSSYQPAWKDSLNNESNTYVPSYQKQVPVNPIVQRQNLNERSNQHYTTITRQPPKYQHVSTQPINLVHRQFNSPMGLYSNDNVQDVMRNHVSHITRVSLVPSLPKPTRATYTVALTPSGSNYTTANTPICYIKPIRNFQASDF